MTKLDDMDGSVIAHAKSGAAVCVRVGPIPISEAANYADEENGIVRRRLSLEPSHAFLTVEYAEVDRVLWILDMQTPLVPFSGPASAFDVSALAEAVQLPTKASNKSVADHSLRAVRKDDEIIIRLSRGGTILTCEASEIAVMTEWDRMQFIAKTTRHWDDESGGACQAERLRDAVRDLMRQLVAPKPSFQDEIDANLIKLKQRAAEQATLSARRQGHMTTLVRSLCASGLARVIHVGQLLEDGAKFYPTFKAEAERFGVDLTNDGVEEPAEESELPCPPSFSVQRRR